MPQIILDDPDWFFWMPDLYGPLKIEADDLASKASEIKIPRKDPGK